MWGPGFDLDRIAATIAPAIEAVDHRTLGTWSARGAEAFLEHFRAVLELTDDAASRPDEVLGLHPDAFVMRVTHSGTAHAGGGVYERQFLVLSVFGADGQTRVEFFDTDREDEALARFDELTAEPAAVPFPAAPSRVAERHGRRVRSNAATANADRIDAAFTARDANALPTLLADESEVVDHTTGATYDRQGDLSSLRALVRAQDPTCRHETLATLGDSLALFRKPTSA